MKDELDAMLKRVGENMLREMKNNLSSTTLLNNTIASVTPAALAWTTQGRAPSLELLERASTAFLAVVFATEYQGKQKAKAE